MNKRPALTLVELILGIAIVAVLAAAGMFGFAKVRQKQALRLSAENLVSELVRARIFSRENRGEKSWGIAGISDNQFAVVTRGSGGQVTLGTYNLMQPAEFDNANFVVWFDQGTGNTAEAKSITLIVPQGETLNVSISEFGTVEIQ